MSFDVFLFYTLAAILVFAAVRMITVRNPVHAALNLVLAFFTSAIIWVTLEAEFLGIVLVLVYVGAVMVLFIFVIMMLDINLAELRAGFIRDLPAGLIVMAIMLIELILVVAGSAFDQVKPPAAPVDYANTEVLGKALYTDYLYPFEIAAFILLVAIVAAIALTLRRRSGVQHQNPSSQMQVRASERVRIVKMESEKD